MMETGKVRVFGHISTKNSYYTMFFTCNKGVKNGVGASFQNVTEGLQKARDGSACMGLPMGLQPPQINRAGHATVYP